MLGGPPHRSHPGLWLVAFQHLHLLSLMYLGTSFWKLSNSRKKETSLRVVFSQSLSIMGHENQLHKAQPAYAVKVLVTVKKTLERTAKVWSRCSLQGSCGTQTEGKGAAGGRYEVRPLCLIVASRAQPGIWGGSKEGQALRLPFLSLFCNCYQCDLGWLIWVSGPLGNMAAIAPPSQGWCV